VKKNWETLKLAALDLENTGLNPFADRIVEIGVIHYYHGQEQGRWSQLVNPGREIPENVQAIHGISDADVENSPPMEVLFPRILQELEDRVLIAHNVQADLPFLEMEAYRQGQKFPSFWTIDTLKLSQKAFPEAPNYQLATLCDYLNLEIAPHRALEDAWGALQIYLRAMEALSLPEDELWPTLRRYRVLVKSGFVSQVKGRTIRDVWVSPGNRYHLTYSNAKGEELERVIQLKNLYMKGRQVCLDAFCEVRGDDRLFFAKNIKDISRV